MFSFCKKKKLKKYQLWEQADRRREKKMKKVSLKFFHFAMFTQKRKQIFSIKFTKSLPLIFFYIHPIMFLGNKKYRNISWMNHFFCWWCILFLQPFIKKNIKWIINPNYKKNVKEYSQRKKIKDDGRCVRSVPSRCLNK